MHEKLANAVWEAKGSYVFDGRDCIAVCDTDNDTESNYARKARLMAAAPKLLRALKAMTSPEFNGPKSAEIWRNAQSVISEVEA